MGTMVKADGGECSEEFGKHDAFYHVDALTQRRRRRRAHLQQPPWSSTDGSTRVSSVKDKACPTFASSFVCAEAAWPRGVAHVPRAEGIEP